MEKFNTGDKHDMVYPGYCPPVHTVNILYFAHERVGAGGAGLVQLVGWLVMWVVGVVVGII